jgi:hypothetical protein
MVDVDVVATALLSTKRKQMEQTEQTEKTQQMEKK